MSRDYDMARYFIEAAAEQDLPEAINELGAMYGKGLGVEKDREQSVRLYRRAAELDNSHANFNLGIMLINGDEVPRDLEGGVAYLCRAAELGDEQSKVVLARLADEYGIGPGADLTLQ